MRDALDRPFTISRGSGATLAPQATLQTCTPCKNKTLEAYPILPRPQGLHLVGALACTPRKRQPKNQLSPWHQENPARTKSTHNRRIASEGVYLLLHRLASYTRWVRSRAPPGKKQPKNKPRPQQRLGQEPSKEHNQRAASEGVYLLLHRLRGYYRVPQLGLPKLG
jgi:hypothetical protein